MRERSDDRGSLGTRGLLLASGLLAAGVAAASLIAPDAFYAVYGIVIDSDINLMNELKGSAGLLLAVAILILRGVHRTEFARMSLGMASAVYLSYALARLVSMTTDGIPNPSLIVAGLIEGAAGAACLVRLLQIRSASAAKEVRVPFGTKP